LIVVINCYMKQRRSY